MNEFPMPPEYAPSLQGVGKRRDLVRDDMTLKGNGYYGNIAPLRHGEVTEFSIGADGSNREYHPGLNPAPSPIPAVTPDLHNVNGKYPYYDIPSVVPGLSREQLRSLNGFDVTPDIERAALIHDAARQLQGKKPFANALEISSYPKE